MMMHLYFSIVKDLNIISQGEDQSKKVFNPDPTKQLLQIVFLCKSNQIHHSKIYVNDTEVKTVNDHGM